MRLGQGRDTPSSLPRLTCTRKTCWKNGRSEDLRKPERHPPCAGYDGQVDPDYLNKRCKSRDKKAVWGNCTMKLCRK